jgi:DNA-binding transcriptional MerR regulator
MFSVGEFSKLAQVSKRQLRFYDGIGLFTPQVVEGNRRRLYTASQLADINRILVLQQLGFSLEQIRELIQDDVSLEELRGMLKLKQAESEQRLEEEQQRYRAIASRLKHLERFKTKEPLDVILKAVPAQQVLSTKANGTLEQGTLLFRNLLERFVEEKGVRYGSFFIHLFGLEYDPEQLEGELGRVIESGQVTTKQNLELSLAELSAEPLMATYVVTGSRHDLHLGYSAIGQWDESGGYTLKGGSREMILQLPQRADGSDTVIEVQLPVNYPS